MKFYLGMDIGGTKCAVVLSEKSGNSIKDKIRFETRTERGWRAVVDELISSARKLAERNEVSFDDIL
ncbi:MAG: ROK family protein, partial [Clostridia bacterium]|nr:ROK family protein [Clostridia bacterium]